MNMRKKNVAVFDYFRQRHNTYIQIRNEIRQEYATHTSSLGRLVDEVFPSAYYRSTKDSATVAMPKWAAADGSRLDRMCRSGIDISVAEASFAGFGVYDALSQVDNDFMDAIAQVSHSILEQISSLASGVDGILPEVCVQGASGTIDVALVFAQFTTKLVADPHFVARVVHAITKNNPHLQDAACTLMQTLHTKLDAVSEYVFSAGPIEHLGSSAIHHVDALLSHYDAALNLYDPHHYALLNSIDAASLHFPIVAFGFRSSETVTG